MKLLKNKLFVIILAIAAVGMVARNIILPISPSERLSSRVESNEETEKRKDGVFKQVDSLENESAQVAEFNNIDWVQGYLRDPFKVLAVVDTEVVSDAPVVIEEEELPIQDVLVAVVHDSGKALAVINDIIVGEGDFYEGYKVVKIDLDSVELASPDGNKTLEF